METGSFHQALHRLERRNRVRPEWTLTESKQGAKFYQLTTPEKKQLTQGHQCWLRLVRAIGAIIEPEVQP